MTTLAEVLDVPSGLFIDDAWTPASKGRTVAHINPATGAVQAEVAAGDVDDVDRAVVAARRALNGWRRWKPAQRRRVLSRVADLMRSQSDRLVAISALESGIPVLVGREIVKMGVEWAETSATWADKIYGEVVPTDPGTFDYVVTEPIGVVGVIMTWNGPVGSLGISVMPALAAGCCVVVKPSELAPFSALMFAEICREAGIPSGVVSVLPGDATTGAALVDHPGVDKVSFTGGVTTSRFIAEACARRGAPVLLELGGKSANLVFDDADLAKAKRSALGVLALSGQGCIVPSRLLVQDGVYDSFLESVVRTFGKMPVGDPLAPTTAVGPVISEAATTRILGFVERAKTAGAGTLLAGGERVGGDLAAGFYVAPTVFGEVDNRSELAQEE
ncbi:MAG TPA: aldehyde dehydrogenase family protein, partial [Sporichthya sp.]|nr:aldehyde dehydrogenase family protein [Sporichthya sp.]